MIRKIVLSSCWVYLIFSVACNPECDSITGLTIEGSPITASGHEILLKAQPLSSLEGRDVFFNSILADTRFEPEAGLIVEIPEDVSGRVEMRIEDADCVDFLSLTLDVKDENFFINNPQFISPAPPQIIIPTTPPPFPPSVAEAWLSPQNLDYCIWFAFIEDTIMKNGMDTIVETSAINPKESAEFSTCRDSNLIYHSNPMYGFVDKAANIVHFWIDRRNTVEGNLGIEEFEGSFIAVEDTPYTEFEMPPCGAGWVESRDHMMLVTSKQTGRKLLLYQQH